MSSVKRNRVIAIIIAFAMCISMMAVMTTTETYAASKPSKVKVYSAKSKSYNSITLKWYKAKNAKKYQVYRATKKYGKYKKVSTTTSKSYTNKKLSFNKTYYYKVRAINGKKKGSFSSIKAVKTKLSTPDIGVYETSSKCITIGFYEDNVAGAKEYYVYRADSKSGTYKKIGKFDGDSYAYTDINVVADKTYYYKMIAYRMFGSKKIYSSYSNIVSAKAEEWYPEETANLDLKYSLVNDEDNPGAMAVVTNNNTKNVYAEIVYIFRDSTGKICEVNNDDLSIIAGGTVYSSVACEYDDMTVEAFVYAHYVDEPGEECYNYYNEDIKVIKIEEDTEDGNWYDISFKNTGTHHIDTVSVALLMKDKDGNVVDVVTYYFDDIAPGEIFEESCYFDSAKYSSFEPYVNYATSWIYD